MRHQVCRYIAMGVMGALLSGIPLLSQGATPKEMPKKTLVKATFVKPNERKGATPVKRIGPKPKVQAPTKTEPKGEAASTKSSTKQSAKQGSKPVLTKGKETMKGSSGEPVIRVLLGHRSQSFTITSEMPMVVLDSAGRQVQAIKEHQSAMISGDGGSVRVNGQSMGTTISIQNAQGRYGSELQTLGKTYRGAITVYANGSGTMSVVNVLGLEQYVQGVVPEEVVPSWPAPALEAQAVAARTYALHSMKHSQNSIYDIGTTTADQVYGGKSSEFASTNTAVKRTHGMVLTYQGQPINALFHSDGGGYTEDSVNLWGNDLPYLKGVVDYSNHEGTTVWNVITSRQSIEQKLAAASKSVGYLQTIELSPLTERPMKVQDRGVSGRVKTMKFIGEKGSVSLTGEQVQSLFGLKSTLFDFYVGQTPPSRIQGSSVKVNHAFSKANQTVTIHGYGWGHGLGLSQWGAAEMASRNEASQPDYYKVILQHYYQGTALTKLYN